MKGMRSVIKRVLRKEVKAHSTLMNLVHKIYIRRFKLLHRKNLFEKMLVFLKSDNIAQLTSQNLNESNRENPVNDEKL